MPAKTDGKIRERLTNIMAQPGFVILLIWVIIFSKNIDNIDEFIVGLSIWIQVHLNINLPARPTRNGRVFQRQNIAGVRNLTPASLTAPPRDQSNC